jgi:hypothetical protein
MEPMDANVWLDDCQRVTGEFNDVSLPAYRREMGNDEDISMMVMKLHVVHGDIHLDVGPRAVFLVEGASGLVFKISGDGHIRYEKCIGHIGSVSGKDLYRWLWW